MYEPATVHVPVYEDGSGTLAAVTVTLADPEIGAVVGPADAVIVTLPALMPVTTPLWLTVAIDSLLDFQRGVRLVRVVPSSPLITAVNCVVPFSDRAATDDGVTETDPTH